MSYTECAPVHGFVLHLNICLEDPRHSVLSFAEAELSHLLILVLTLQPQVALQ